MKHMILGGMVSVLLAIPAAAQQLSDECAALLRAWHAEILQPEPGADPDDCITVLQSALTLNLPAVSRAEPVTGVEQVVGTWLGDDVRLPMMGIMTPGQEVLRITEGPQPDTVTLTQFWYKARLPGRETAPFDEQGQYVGQVAQVVLRVVDRGTFLPDTFDNPIQFSPGRFQFRRSNELFVLSRINHFDIGGRLLRDDDTLVLESRRFPIYPNTQEWLNGATYTRVSDEAPDLALQLVTMYALSQSRYFDCLAHQITGAEGALFDAIAPATLVDLSAHVSALVTVKQGILALQQEITVTEDRAERYQRLIQRFAALNETSMEQALRAAVADNALGCPSPF